MLVFVKEIIEGYDIGYPSGRTIKIIHASGVITWVFFWKGSVSKEVPDVEQVVPKLHPEASLQSFFL